MHSFKNSPSEKGKEIEYAWRARLNNGVGRSLPASAFSEVLASEEKQVFVTLTDQSPVWSSVTQLTGQMIKFN